MTVAAQSRHLLATTEAPWVGSAQNDHRKPGLGWLAESCLRLWSDRPRSYQDLDRYPGATALTRSGNADDQSNVAEGRLEVRRNPSVATPTNAA